MPYSKTPMQSTYNTKPVKLLDLLSSRDRSELKDAFIENGYVEVYKDKEIGAGDYEIVKREGLSVYPYNSGSTNVRGVYYWKEQNKIFVAKNGVIDVLNTSGTLITTLALFGTTTGDVGFTEFIYDTGEVVLMVTDGAQLYRISATNVTTLCTDPDLPTPHLPSPVFLDGYLLLVKAGTADIYNSVLNDPLAFTAGDFISAEMMPDTLVRIAKMNNYILAFGTSSIEYFWDAANATGSPLQRNDTPVKFIGFLGGFAQQGNIIFFLGAPTGALPAIYMLQDFKISVVSTLPIRKYIQPATAAAATIISLAGKDFYSLGFGAYTFMCDLDSGLWSRFSTTVGTDFPAYRSLCINYPGFGNVTLCFFTTNGQVYFFDSTKYQDYGFNFTFRIQSDPITFDTNRYKTVGRISVIGDQTSGTSLLNLQWSDDDYQTWNTARPVDMGTQNPVAYRGGRFRKRAFRLSYTDNYPMRIKALEIDMNVGER